MPKLCNMDSLQRELRSNLAVYHDDPQICAKCKISPAEDFCCCQFPVILLCKMCQSDHFLSSPGVTHSTMPADFASKVTSSDHCALLSFYLLNLSTARTKLQEQINEVTECQEALWRRCAKLREDLEIFIEKKVNRLERFKQELTAVISDGLETIKWRLFDDHFREESLLRLVWESARKRDFSILEVFSFSTRADELVDFNNVMGITWRSKLDLLEDNRNPADMVDEQAMVERAAKSLASRDFESIEALQQTSLAEFDRFSNPEKLLLAEKAAYLWLKNFFIVAKAKEQALSQNLQLPVEKSVWIAKVSAVFSAKCQQRSSSNLVESIKKVASDMYENAANRGKTSEFEAKIKQISEKNSRAESEIAIAHSANSDLKSQLDHCQQSEQRYKEQLKEIGPEMPYRCYLSFVLFLLIFVLHRAYAPCTSAKWLITYYGVYSFQVSISYISTHASLYFPQVRYLSVLPYLFYTHLIFAAHGTSEIDCGYFVFVVRTLFQGFFWLSLACKSAIITGRAPGLEVVNRLM